MADRPSFRVARRALLLSLPLYASVASSASTDETRVQIDRELQALKAEVLDLQRSAATIEEGFLYPAQTRVSIYVGLQAPGLLVEQVTITVDDNPPTLRKFDVFESIALQRRGLYRALRLNATPGAHRIRVQYSGRYADAKPGTPPMQGRHEAVFEKTTDPSDLEVRIRIPAFGLPGVISLHDWRPAS